MTHLQRVAALSGAAIIAAAVPWPAVAQADRIDALERQLGEQQKRIEALEALVLSQQATIVQHAQAEAPAHAAVLPDRTNAQPVTAAAQPRSKPEDFRIAGLHVSGDVRVREEFNFSDSTAADRARSVLRARLRAIYQVTDKFAVGGQLATGDPDDPNSTDITLSAFDDDLAVSLDQAWLRYKSGGLTAYAGKFPMIFQRTDMVWDGDVVPEGIGASYAFDLGGGARLDGRAMYFVIDESAGGPDSYMLGGQAALTLPLSTDFRLLLTGGYYGYTLSSLTGADSGDFRSNLMSGGRYLSDFRLVEGLGMLTWNGLGERHPVTLTGDYVRNLGAAVSADHGFDVELSLGRSIHKGDWRLFYNYSEVGVDAVFAAFSHDNLGIATNYRLHGLILDYVPLEHILFNATYYHYRPLDAAYVGTNAPRDWLDRVRVNMQIQF